MASLPPKIDQRTYEEIVEQTKNLAQQFTNWRPAQGDTKDAGEALIRIFARMVKSASDRVNQVPEKNFLAFLDLIGGQLNPPLPAKVPLTFYLAEGSPTDGLVPAYTRVSAPPAEGSDEEIMFESDRELVVTTAQLQAVFVRESSQDKYSERTLEATGQKDEAFLAFSGNRPIEHSLYISCPEIFTLPELPELKLIITTDNNSQFPNLILNWSYWDGSQWRKIIPTSNSSEEDNQSTITFQNLPIPIDSEIHGITAKWLQAKLTNISAISENSPQITNIQGSIDIEKSNLIPEICLFNNTPLDLSKDFYPFGEQPEINDTFYIALHDTFIKPNVTITISINLTDKPENIDDLEITSEIGNGKAWQKVEMAVNEDEKVVWTDKYDIDLITIENANSYTDELTQEGMNLVILAKIGTGNDVFYHVRIFNRNGTQVIDKSKDEITPDDFEHELSEAFGSQPIDDLIKSKLIQKITSSFDNKIKLSLDDSPLDFIKSKQQVTLKFPNKENMPSPSTVNGETRYWIRARITQGHYGKTEDERQYPFYNELAVLTEEILKPEDITTEVKKIKVDSLDFFQVGDKIRLFPNTEGFPEEHQIAEIDQENKQLTLNSGILNEKLEVGTRVMRKSIITETIPPTYDPPLVKSLKLTYNCPLEEEAIYFAENDFHYSYPGDDFRPFTPTEDQDPTLYLGFDKSFDNKTVTLYAQVEPPLPDELSIDITTETFLTEAADVGQTIVELSDVTGWQSGDTIEIQNPSNKKKYDSYTISDINNNQITLSESLEQNYSQRTPVIYPKQPKLVWKYSCPLGWQPLGVQDETQAFSQRGLIQFIAPADFSTRDTFGKQLYWLRVCWQGGNFRVKPRLRRLLTNTIWAVQATTLTEEVLGSSNSEPNQVFVANNTPLLIGQQLEVEEGQIPEELESERIKIIRDDLGEIESVWILWQEVADFYGSGASDRHYILDRQTGEIRFGDGQAGMIPPRGRNNIRLSFYRTGGGEPGNVADETISQLNTTIPYIDRVINLEAAGGGANQENLERLKQRVPKQLRHRDRAVTIDDLADLAYEASTDVARVKVVSPDLITANFSPFNENFWLDPTSPKISFKAILESKSWKKMNDQERANNKTILQEVNRRAGQVKLIVLPHSSDRQPVPSLALLEQVETYIRDRCQPTMDLVVTAPKWQAVTVTVTITPVSFDQADILRNTVKQSLEDYLHPLTGGTGEGWQFGRYPEKSDFYAIIQSISGVDHVNSLEVEKASLTADTVIYSGNHVVYLSQ